MGRHTMRALSVAAVVSALLVSCGPRGQEPEELYPEDICSLCRMAVSDPRFAAEIVSAEGEVFKFDDIGCLESFQEQDRDLPGAAVFVKDFESALWLPIGEATIVSTEMSTPMGSGKLAFSSPEASRRFLERLDPSGL
ncbi:MAG TPA: nitrous oxide reductase accessory protein NosL [Candidatus Krumholzibacterium sp.]|nr:nitrous oxide reductase accessory protein NosL [Candidatus Krumholzibacterium sp.]